MCIKHYQKYILIFIVMLVSTIPFFIYIAPTTVQNVTVYNPFTSLRIRNIEAYVALIVGFLAFVGTIYNTDKTFEVTKLSSIPDYSVNLLIDLEFIFNALKTDDNIVILSQILKYWGDHQKAFRFLTPIFYKKFVKLIANLQTIDENDEIYEKNSKYIINAILTHITNIAFNHEIRSFYFIKPDMIRDEWCVKVRGRGDFYYVDITFNTFELKEYIGKIHGQKTKQCTKDKFEVLEKDIEDLICTLKREIEKYDG